MTQDNLASYRFLPWLRRGISSAYSTPDNLGSGLDISNPLSVTFRVNGSDAPAVGVRPHGPSDVIGVDRRAVIRIDPQHRTSDFEPNFFPAIEFEQPDFPWLFTPLRESSQDKLRPWVCLVVVAKQEGVRLGHDPSKPLPVLEIESPAAAASELPDLNESWAWAHTQLTTGSEEDESLETVIEESPERLISRLVAPRRLSPKTSYYACLVPVFSSGLKAGLGEELTLEEEQTLDVAWTLNDDLREIRIPVYYHWEFTTGAAGDFETLVMRLKARETPDTVGLRDMDVSEPGYGMPAAARATLGLEAPLKGPTTRSTRWPDFLGRRFQRDFTELLDLPDTLSAEDEDPLVAPPIYGRWHAARTTVPGRRETPRWLRELNLDPRHRAAAGFGTLVVQQQQEQLMAAAWDQIGDVKLANAILRQAQMSRAASEAAYERRIKRMPTGYLLQFSTPVHGRILSAGATVKANIASSSLPTSLVDTAYRRISRPRGPIGRRSLPVGSRVLQTTLEKIVAGTITQIADAITPKGMLTAENVTAASTIQVRTKPSILDATPTRISALSARNTFNIADTSGVLARRTSVIRGRDTADATRFRKATTANQEMVLRSLKSQSVTVPILDLDREYSVVLEKLLPGPNVVARIKGRIGLPTGFWDNQADELEPIMAAPEFPQPMYEPLRNISTELLLPGLSQIPANTVTLVETNPRFIESYMVGLNHEMGRELLWREYPTDQRGSYFRQFWDVSGRIPQPETEAEEEALKDIKPIDSWRARYPLGRNSGDGSGSQLVLLIRGDLLRRYPNAVIYAVQAVEASDGRDLGDEERHPLFQGEIGPDVTFLGFDLTEKEARGSEDGDQGWFFVIQEQPTEPRFGLETSGSGNVTSWTDLAWTHLVDSIDELDGLTYIGLAANSPSTSLSGWGGSASQMANITLQRPFRMAIHADAMLPSA